jgi:hypothetical protein
VIPERSVWASPRRAVLNLVVLVGIWLVVFACTSWLHVPRAVFADLAIAAFVFVGGAAALRAWRRRRQRGR